MKAWTTAAVTLTAVTALGVGAAMAPVAQGQGRTRNFDDWPLLHVFGAGSHLGVSVRDLDDADVKRLKGPGTGGVLIEDVQSESPAEKAGMRDGDVVVEFDGERVRSARQFSRLVQETSPDRQVQAVVIRDGQRTTLSVQPTASGSWSTRDFGFGDLHITPPTPPTPPRVDGLPRIERFFAWAPGRLGISVDSLSDQLADYFGTKEGVLVTSVYDNSAAAKAGLKAGDVITAINRGVVRTPSDLTRRAERLEAGDEFTLDVVRDKKPLTLKGKVEERPARRWTARTII